MAAGILGFSLVACSAMPERYDDRVRDTLDHIEAWEQAIEGSAPDRGWSMLSLAGQRGFASEEQYISLAEAADWSAFDLQPLAGYCDDLYACNINVLVPGGIESAPAFLLSSPNDRENARYGLLLFNPVDGGPPGAPDPELGNAQMQVLWERVPWPDAGIGGGGG